jgi:hypothetical protein
VSSGRSAVSVGVAQATAATSATASVRFATSVGVTQQAASIAAVVREDFDVIEAVAQSAASVSVAIRDVFQLGVVSTQPAAAPSATARASDPIVVNLGQSAAAIATEAGERFRLATSMGQSRATVSALVTVTSNGSILAIEVTQRVASVSALIDVAPPPTPAVGGVVVTDTSVGGASLGHFLSSMVVMAVGPVASAASASFTRNGLATERNGPQNAVGISSGNRGGVAVLDR